MDHTKTEEDEEDDNMSDGCYDNSILVGPDGAMKKKQKRRSKNDVHGRDHRCTFCEKTYLSYPALYTHIKNKHARGPDGQPLIQFNSGRGRGRPKKNSLGHRNQVEPTSRNFFRTIDKIGGPIEPNKGFSEIYTEIFVRKRTRIAQSKEEPSEIKDSDGEADDGEVSDAKDNDAEAEGQDDEEMGVEESKANNQPLQNTSSQIIKDQEDSDAQK